MKKNIIIYLIILVVLIVIIFIYFLQNKETEIVNQNLSNVNTPAEQKTGYTNLLPEEAFNLINENSKLIIIDVSPNYDKGHLPDSINYYVGDGSLDNAIPSLDKEETYLVYCHVDSAAVLGAQKLVDAGFTKVYRLVGNYSAWVAAGYPVEIFLEAVLSYSGTALATRSYKNNKFQHRVEMQTSDLAEGKFFEGWLVKSSPSLSFFSTGRLEKIDDKYILEYQSSEDQTDFNEVVITEETEANGLDNIPEIHIFEGVF